MADPTTVPATTSDGEPAATTADTHDATASRAVSPPSGHAADAPADRPSDWVLTKLQAMDPAPGVVVDVGCGQDTLALEIATAAPGTDVIGIDDADRLAPLRDAAPAAAASTSPTGTLHLEAAALHRDAALPLGDDRAEVVVLGDVLARHLDPAGLLGEVARVLRPGGLVLVAAPFGLQVRPEVRRTLYASTLLELVGAVATVRELDLVDGLLRLTARLPADTNDRVEPGDTARAPAPSHAALLAAVQPKVDAALHDAEVAAYEAGIERARLADQAAQLGVVVQERDKFEGRSERLETALLGERERNQRLRFQRDRYRHQAASLRARRWWRLGAAIAEARRNPAKILLLPLTLLKVLFGPPAKPAVPEPIPPGEAVGETKDISTAQLQSPTETRPTARLEARYLLPPRGRSVTELKVAAVVDTFTESSLAPDCDLMVFRPDTWRASLELERPNLLFVESAWKGHGGSWEYQVGSYSYPTSVGLPHLTELVSWCREHDIPTVFWNKEDPVHFNKFKEAARLFDIVLTTDADRIPAYEALDGAARIVAALPFAAQPRLHHPTHELAERDPRPVFGGTYYKNRHPERREQLERLLDAARDRDLVIYDRTAGQESDSVGFPERFAPHIRGGVPYDEMVRLYREHRLFLNTNSVIDSPTMFSRRVFELLACGTPVVSTPGRGMQTMFGDLVPVVSDVEAARTAIDALLTDDARWQERSLAGIRAVLAEHTYQHRLARVASFAGYRGLDPYADRDATVLLLDDDHDRAHGLCTELAARSSTLRVVVGTPDPARFGELPVATVRQDAAADERTRWRELAARVETPYVVLADALATPDALSDLVLSLRMTEAAAVGYRFGGPAWRHVDEVLTAPIALRRDLVVDHGWDTDVASSAAQLASLAALGHLPYSLGDPAGRVPVRAV